MHLSSPQAICYEHNRVHGVQIIRCDGVVAAGLPRNSGLFSVRCLRLVQEKGCEGFVFSAPVRNIRLCSKGFYVDSDDDLSEILEP
ncbi:hypothetical protein AAE478_007138 [Parahypoxylon ruwenzoriense]